LTPLVFQQKIIWFVNNLLWLLPEVPFCRTRLTLEWLVTEGQSNGSWKCV